MKEQYKERRAQLLRGLQAPASVVLFSGYPPMRSADEEYPFSVDRSFYYYTGLEDRGMVLVLRKVSDLLEEEELYAENAGEQLMKWEGRTSDFSRIAGICGVDKIYDKKEFMNKFHSFIYRECGEKEINIYLDLWKYKTEQTDMESHKFCAVIRERYPQLRISDVYEKLVRQRIIKSDEEVACIKKAIKATKEALLDMISHTRDGIGESELEGVFDLGLKRRGIRENAFPSIVAGGRRALILHYRNNDQPVKEGELVLADLGGTHRHYCADISRTFPVGKTFSPQQKKLYEIVLEAQRRVIDGAKPGMTLKQLDEIVTGYYQEVLDKEGYLKDGRRVEDMYYHGVSHHLGLDTHDICCRRYDKLEPGMVITVEPGLYDAAAGVAIRIEDDIRITESGAENLSWDIPKTVEEIEALKNQYRA